MRTSKISRRIIDDFITAIKATISRRGACGIAGISEATLYNWIRKAEEAENKEDEALEEEEELYLLFLERLKEAEGEVEKELVTEVKKDGADGAKWLLSKRFRTEYGTHFEVDIKDDSKQQYEIIWPDLETPDD